MLSYIHETINYHSDIDILFKIHSYHRSYTPPHWHNSLEIIYLLEGVQEFFLGEDHQQILHPNDFLIINSREIHSVRIPGHSLEMLIQIPYPFLKRYLPNIDRVRFHCTAGPADPVSSREFRHIRDSLRSISRIYPLRSAADALRFHSMIFELLSRLLTFFHEDISPAQRASSAKYLQRLGHITSYVQEHYAEDLSLDQIAAEVSLNPDYFTRFFKKYMGMTFLDYVNSIRLEHIARDLLNTDLSIQQLTELHGFTNYKLFMKMYKTRFNCTPGEMRRQIKPTGSFS